MAVENIVTELEERFEEAFIGCGDASEKMPIERFIRLINSEGAIGAIVIAPATVINELINSKTQSFEIILHKKTFTDEFTIEGLPTFGNKFMTLEYESLPQQETVIESKVAV